MTESQPLFSFLRLPERATKPRATGFTMIEGDLHLAVSGMNWLQDLVRWAGNYIDYYKLGYTMMLQPRDLVAEKLALLKQHNIEVYPQGNAVEVAIKRGCLDALLDEFHALGIRVVEVSSTHLPLALGDKTKVTEKAKQLGFKVFAEIGKKFIGLPGGPKTHMATPDVIREMKECLDAGAFKVVYEYTEVVSLLAEDGGLERFLEVVAAVGADKIMFEVPTNIVPTWRDLSRYATLYIEHVGPNVNIGDVDPAHVLTLEAMRLGLTSRSRGKGLKD
jgi:phosphosulfolactate synthase